MLHIYDKNDNNITFNDMPYEIKYMILDKMKCSEIVKTWYFFPSTHTMIQEYLIKHNFNTIESYILNNLNNYVDIETRNKLLNFPQRLCYILMLFELGYYNYAIEYCTIEDEEQFNNFIKLMRFTPYIQDAFEFVVNIDKEIVNKIVLLSNYVNMTLEEMYNICSNI